MPSWADDTIDLLVDLLPYLLGAVVLVLAVSLMDGSRRRSKQDESEDE